MSDTRDYPDHAESDARDTVSEFKDTILEALLESGEASEDLRNDYPNGDAWHHECHVDRSYSLRDAADLIDQLSEYEETDSGLWEGQQPKEAIGTCAAFTYGNAVYAEWVDLIKEINSNASIIVDDYDGRIGDAEEADDTEEADDLRNEKKDELEDLIDRIIAGC